jgi:DNA excision repair protein ERCC-2
LLEFHFRSLQFLRTAEVWGDEFRCELSRSDGQQSLRLKLNCLDPGRLLAERQAALHSVTMFSATLSPAAWLRPRLGLGPDTVVRQVASPFRQDQLQVEINRSIDTRYRGRGESLPALAGAIGDWLQRKQGNCLVYFPSYRYLDDCLALLVPDHPALAERELWVQARTQDASQRAQLLERLGARRNLAAFCILGGVFGEGIDLPGDQLASVVVVGVGLPQVDREARQLQAFYDAREGAGFDFAFRFPGMQKVNQALGRVIRGATDRGDALLIDPRYGEREYRDLLAPWWCYREAGSPQARASEPGKR